MSIYQVNKKTLLVLVVCVIAVLSTALYVNRGKVQQENNNPKNTKTIQISSSTQNISNSDWRKDFFTGSITTKTVDSSKSKNLPEKPLTLTDRLGREFFTRYVQLRQGNLTDDQKSVQEAMDRTISEAINTAPKPKIYNTSNIILSNITGSEGLRSYANSVGQIFAENSPRADPTEIASNALENDDLKSLSKIDPIINSYGKILNKLLSLPVPKILSLDHIDLINSVSSMIYVSKGLRNITADPMQAMVALNLYQATMDSMIKTLKDMQNYFRAANLYFSETDPGFMFSTLYNI